MSDKNTGGPAFPLQYDPYVDHPVHGRVHRSSLGEGVQEGMTLRDYFAAKAMQGIISAVGDCGDVSYEDSTVAESAYEMADAMLKAREL